jgi:uncharacterized LabA/DUF88 family protein
MANILDRLIHPDERVGSLSTTPIFTPPPRASPSISTTPSSSEEFRKRGRFIHASYYTALLEDQDFSPIRPLVDWLDYNGYCVFTKPAKDYTDASGRRRFKGDMDVEIAVDLVEAAAHTDHAFLFSGDATFCPPSKPPSARGWGSPWSPP